MKKIILAILIAVPLALSLGLLLSLWDQNVAWRFHGWRPGSKETVKFDTETWEVKKVKP